MADKTSTTSSLHEILQAGIEGLRRSSKPPTCFVTPSTLQEVYRVLATAGSEAAERLLSTWRSDPTYAATLKSVEAQLEQGAPRSATEILEAKAREAYAVAVILQGANGERVLGSEESVLDAQRYPRPLQSITLQLGHLPGPTTLDKASLNFDLSKPPLLDLSNPSGAPTPNNSLVTVEGSNTTWATGLYSKLETILNRHRTRWGWIHRPYTYDVLLVLFGFPASLSAVAKSSEILTISGPLHFAVLVYVFFLTLYVFRLAFGVVRWVFPYVELRGTEDKPTGVLVRAAIVTVMLSALGSLLFAGVASLF